MSNSSASLPPGIRARFVDNGNGLTQHVLEAGFEEPDRPSLLLLHGFPELAFSWRAVMPILAAAGYHVVAPDQRGYGPTTGDDRRYDCDLDAYGALNLVRDALGLLSALGLRTVEAVVVHYFGAHVAAYCALTRPDVFRRVALMSAPFAGPPAPGAGASPFETMNRALGALTPPRKHYHWHYCKPEADLEMRGAPQGLHAFLRAYFHYKSGDWSGNHPHPLQSWSADELAKLPSYYVMARDQGMAATVAPFHPSASAIAENCWLPDGDLAVYVAEYARAGFQGGLNWYRARLVPSIQAELAAFAGRRIEIPACFIAGERDWGVHQAPGALAKMEREVCARYAFTALIPGAGHWAQQEAAAETAASLLRLLVE